MQISKIEKIQNIDFDDVWQGKTSGVKENVKVKIVVEMLELLGFDKRLNISNYY